MHGRHQLADHHPRHDPRGGSLPHPGLSITTITLIGYSAMAGAVGGGGLGDVALRYGYHRYQADVMMITIVLLVIIVCIIQIVFDHLASRVDKRNR